MTRGRQAAALTLTDLAEAQVTLELRLEAVESRLDVDDEEEEYSPEYEAWLLATIDRARAGKTYTLEEAQRYCDEAWAVHGDAPRGGRNVPRKARPEVR